MNDKAKEIEVETPGNGSVVATFSIDEKASITEIARVLSDDTIWAELRAIIKSEQKAARDDRIYELSSFRTCAYWMSYLAIWGAFAGHSPVWLIALLLAAALAIAVYVTFELASLGVDELHSHLGRYRRLAWWKLWEPKIFHINFDVDETQTSDTKTDQADEVAS